MILTDLETALAAVEATFSEVSAGFLPLARSYLKEPALDLSRLLIGTMALGATGRETNPAKDSSSLMLSQNAAQSSRCNSGSPQSGFGFVGQKADEARGEGAYVQIRDRAEGEENEADGVFGRVLCACRALELLDQALALGASVLPGDGYNEDRLLVTDYLYGQAIDQVIEADRPAVIAILADAISGAAEDRLVPHGEDRRPHLVVAALDIAATLADFGPDELAAVSRIRAAASGGADNWRDLLPAGEIGDFIQSSRAAAAAD